VSRAKFEHELGVYRAREDEYRRRGWWLLAADFPQVFVVFATPRTTPPAVVFGALFDFTNYDFWPPSVRLVDPFTRVPYRAKDLPTVLKRRTVAPMPPEALAALGLPAGAQAQNVQDSPLMLAYGPDEVPFLCLPGVREYHEHPAHSNDPWLRHRDDVEGSLHFLLETLYRYGVEPITEYAVQLVPRVTFAQAEVPE
jgi:hypothetical protein